MFFGKHLCKAQAQQLTESNEQMAPQAKDAGKSERSPRFDLGVFFCCGRCWCFFFVLKSQMDMDFIDFFGY